MKKLFLTTLFFFLSFSLMLSVSGEAYLLADDASLLTADQNSDLCGILEEKSQSTGAQIAVVTADLYPGSSIEAYTEELCDNGLMENGLLLFVSMGTREYCLTKCGWVEDAIDGEGLDFIEDAFLPYMSDGQYYTAFSIFASLSADAIESFNSSGTPYSGDDFSPDIQISTDGTVTVTEGSRPITHYLICFAAGLLLAFISMLIMQSGMKSVKSRNHAADYVVHGSLDLRISTDRFLYRTVTKTPKPQSNSSSGRSIGGSGRSSSGRF